MTTRKITGIIGGLFAGALAVASVLLGRGAHAEPREQPSMTISAPVPLPATAADLQRVTTAIEHLSEVQTTGFLGLEHRVTALETTVKEEHDAAKEERLERHRRGR